MLEEEYIDNLDEFAAFKLAYWHEKFSPEIDLEKSYLWYSVAVSSGNYKAMKFRDRGWSESDSRCMNDQLMLVLTGEYLHERARYV